MLEKSVAKFGGTSMQDAQCMKNSAKLVLKYPPKLVVVSATARTTDALVSLTQSAQNGDWSKCENIIEEIKKRHISLAQEFQNHKTCINHIDEIISETTMIAKGVSLLQELTPRAKDIILSAGERLSSAIFVNCLKSFDSHYQFSLLDARKVLITNTSHNNALPLVNEISRRCKLFIDDNENHIYLTQGFIGSSLCGLTTTLGRGGSDSSAALFAEAINARVLRIWTDVAGVATVDPRVCDKAQAIEEITYQEAAEMAQYGAKVLHPATLLPAIRQGIRIFVGSSFESEKKGTWIQEKTKTSPVLRALSKRDNQCMLIIKTPEMLNASGFLEKIFKIFREYELSVDCVTTSEISVALTLDQTITQNVSLLSDLRNLGDVQIEKDLALISIIGNQMRHTQGLGRKIFEALSDVNVRMICLGASEFNFCILVESLQVDKAINNLHSYFVDQEKNQTRKSKKSISRVNS